MRITVFIMLVLTLLGPAFRVSGQFNPGKVCRMDDGQLVFTLDTRWTQAQRKEIAALFDLDSILLAQAFAAKPVINNSGNIWKTKKLDAYFIELSKEHIIQAEKPSPVEQVFLMEDDRVRIEAATELTSVPYGINKLTRNTIVQLTDNRLRFFLPGYKKAGKVFLAGSFNAWSTMETPMQRSDSGWVTTLKLDPGKHTYKFIVDGKWTNDSYNREKEDDLNGGYNSIFFCYNYQFVLKEFPDAHKVYLAGSFNNWNGQEIRMIRFTGRWVVNLFLREGTHAYKFVVDNQWINDPANKITRPDGKGNLNSFMSLGDTLYFYLKGFPKAQKVAVSGNFNGWNSGELFMTKVPGGWELPYVLRAGIYEYKFVVDGKWIADPANPNTTGAEDYTNSILAVKPNYSFRMEKFPEAKSVVVTGSFNGWSNSGYNMVKHKGAWVFPIYLDPGKYTYKFIVDGKYMLDPANDLWEENEYGTGNSVLWINP